MTCTAGTALVSGVIGAFLLENFSPYVNFFFFGFSGLIISVTSCFIPREIEEDQMAY
jgi:zinc transporter ZupT